MYPKWYNYAIYGYIFYSLYSTDWIANTEIVLDPNNSVIKRLRCVLAKPASCVQYMYVHAFPLLS